VKTLEEQEVGAHSVAHSTLGVEGRVGDLGWGLGRVTNINYSHGTAQTKQQVD
jgi:hypothetical protein